MDAVVTQRGRRTAVEERGNAAGMYAAHRVEEAQIQLACWNRSVLSNDHGDPEADGRQYTVDA